MSPRIGINPITWSNDDLPSLGGHISLETCLSEARAAGYDGIELGGKFPRDAVQLRALLDRHSLDLVSGWYSGRLCERDEHEELALMRPHLELLRALNVDFVIFAETSRAIHGDPRMPLRLRPCLAQANWPQFSRRLDALAQRLRDSGMRLVFHHHMGTVVQVRDEIERLLDSTGAAVELLLDTGHLLFAGADPVACAADWIGRIGHVHCKDVRRAVLDRSLNRNTSFLKAVIDGVFTVPGDGCIDYATLFRLLQARNYAGWLVVEAEQDPSVAEPFACAELGRRNIARLWPQLQDAAPAGSARPLSA